MAEAAAAYLAEALWAAEFVEAAIVVLNYGAAIVQAAAFVASVYVTRDAQKRAQNRARDAYNESLRDRYVMFRATSEPRRIVLGTQRVSGPLAFIGSYGDKKENLVYAAIMAAEEIDGYNKFYFDDELLILDGDGYVIGQQKRDLFSTSASTDSFTLAETPEADTVEAEVNYGSGSIVTLTIVSVVDKVVTVSGGTAGTTGAVTVKYVPQNSPWQKVTDNIFSAIATFTLGTATIAAGGYNGLTGVVASTVVGGDETSTLVTPDSATYDAGTGTLAVTVPGSFTGSLVVSGTGAIRERLCRIAAYTGHAGQTADPSMLAAAPDLWTSAHVMTNLAYVVVTAKFSQDAFPGGLMSVSAEVRGSKIYDARTATTAFTENPALQIRHIAYHPFFGNQPSGVVNDTLCNAAANACDESVTYVVNGLNVVRPKYKAGLIAKSGVRSKDIMDDLAAAMAGKWVFSEGEICMRAGVALSVTQTLDDTWLSDAQAVEIQVGNNRSDVINIITGKFADADRAFVEMPFTPVRSSTYITEDGAELSQDIQLNAVTSDAQCQQVAASMLRDARQDLRITLLCNMRAFQTQALDVINVNLPRFGFVNLRCEVLDRAFTLDGGIQLVMKKQDVNAWNMGTSFTTPVQSNTTFRNPNDLPIVAGLTLYSGPSEAVTQADGIVTPRMRVTWTPTDDRYVLFGGGVELRYGQAGTPYTTWNTIFVVDDASATYLTGLRDGVVYGVQARYFTQATRGRWNVAQWLRFLGGNSQLDTGQIVSGAVSDTIYTEAADYLSPGASDGANIDTLIAATTFTNASALPVQVNIDWNYIAQAQNLPDYGPLWKTDIRFTLNGVLKVLNTYEHRGRSLNQGINDYVGTFESVSVPAGQTLVAHVRVFSVDDGILTPRITTYFNAYKPRIKFLVLKV